MVRCGLGTLVWGYYAGPLERTTTLYEPPCPVRNATACWREVTLCTPFDAACWRAARVGMVDVSNWELLLNWETGDPLYRSVPRALVKLRNTISVKSSKGNLEMVCGEWPQLAASRMKPIMRKHFSVQDRLFNAVAESVQTFRDKHSCQNDVLHAPCISTPKRKRNPGVTLHLSFVLDTHDAGLVKGGRIARILQEAVKIDACLEDVIITADVPAPKNAEHSAQVLASSLARDMISHAQQDLQRALRKLMVRCKHRPHGAVVVMDYGNTSFLQKMAIVISRAFGLVPPNMHAIEVTRWVLNVIKHMFKSTPQQFYAYAHARAELFLHQDGDRGIQFKQESQVIRTAVHNFATVPRLFYIGLPACPGVDSSQDMFHSQYLGGDRPFEDSLHVKQNNSMLVHHWSEYAGLVFRHHVSMCGFIMNLSRFRAMWPFLHWDRHIDLLHDANVERFLWHPSAPALAASMANEMASEGCAVGQTATW